MSEPEDATGESEDLRSDAEPAGAPSGDPTSRNGVGRSTLILSVIAAALIAGLAGLGIGAKVEQGRVKDDVKNIRPVGTVTAVTDSSVTVNLVSSKGTRTYQLTDETVVETADSTDASDVVEGSTILVKNRRDADGNLRAIEIVVLPDSTTFGQGGRGK